MTGFMSIFKREIKSYFATPVAYVFLTTFLIASAFRTFQNGFFRNEVATMRTFFADMPIILLVVCTAIAMRLWAEERRSNSIELLFSLPITTPQAVLAKFGAAWTVMVLAMGLTCPMLFTLTYLGDPDSGPIITSYLGCVLLSGVYLAIGSFFSTITKNQVISLVLAIAVGCAFLLAGSPKALSFVAGYLPKAADLLEIFSFQSRFESIQRGVLEVRDLLFYLILIAGWLWANIIVLEERRSA